jgi:hypothetical protein
LREHFIFSDNGAWDTVDIRLAPRTAAADTVRTAVAVGTVHTLAAVDTVRTAGRRADRTPVVAAARRPAGAGAAVG